jgi:hypothetical protein
MVGASDEKKSEATFKALRKNRRGGGETMWELGTLTLQMPTGEKRMHDTDDSLGASSQEFRSPVSSMICMRASSERLICIWSSSTREAGDTGSVGGVF